MVLLKTDFEADWIVEVRRVMEEHWAMDLASAKTEELAALFFHARTRRVEPRPRAVYLSNAFVCPPEHEAGWAALKLKIETGEDLSPHLSLKIEDFKAKDWLLLDWGHGVKLHRLALSSSFFILIYAFLYHALQDQIQASPPLESFFDYVYFSMVTFTTLGYGDILPKTTLLRMICGTEAFLGAFMMGLVVAGFTNRKTD